LTVTKAATKLKIMESRDAKLRPLKAKFTEELIELLQTQKGVQETSTER